MPKIGSSSHGQLSAKEALAQISDVGPFVPTVTAIATAPDLKWMVLSTDISSVGPCSGDKQKKTHTPQKKTHTPQKKTHTPQKKTDTSQRKTEPEKGSTIPVGRRKAQKEQASSVNLEKMALSPVALHQEPMISGDSDVLLCSSAELEPYIDIKNAAMEELGSKMEYNEDDMDLLVPDIDLTASLGLSEWETLYMSMGGSLEPLAFDFTQGEEYECGKIKPAAENSTLLTL
ncbi:hypothetical protein Baya_16716 [Bagarius yarrelli]|uniref:Uncharacterized protein n=1 Tax=Bagarius yarrelli TaxID=175774 RepID=A0A556VW99_BAGYA|nr:hypothetical protein Baya_16716 [Bagarius yarrelli]